MSSPYLSGVVSAALDEFDRRNQTEAYFNDPVAWSEYMLGAHLWSRQREIAYSVMENKSVAVKAGHGLGKSWLAAMLICHWVDTRYPDVFVMSTAPSLAQVASVLWREVRTMKNLIEERYNAGIIDHKLPGKINAFNEWKTDDGSIIGFGRKPPDQKEESGVQGIHARYVLAVGDESVGLSAEMIDALANITSNTDSRRFLISNPTNPMSHTGRIFRENTGAWTLHTISVLDSPAFTGEVVPDELMDKLTGPEYVEDKKLEYGEDSARYKARVLGEFAFDVDDTLIGPEDIEKAKATEFVLDPDSRPILGVDVARFGGDSSVVYENRDGQVRFLDSWNGATTTETASRVHRIALDRGAIEVRVDSIGIGAGVADQLDIMEGRNYWLRRMDSAASSPNRLQWHNARAYWWDNVRSKLRSGAIDLDPSDETVQDELCSPKYKFNLGTGGLVIESKDDMKKRGLKSPDYADAFIFAACDPEPVTDNPLDNMRKGDRVFADPDDILGEVPYYLDVIGKVWA